MRQRRVVRRPTARLSTCACPARLQAVPSRDAARTVRSSTDAPRSGNGFVPDPVATCRSPGAVRRGAVRGSPAPGRRSSWTSRVDAGSVRDTDPGVVDPVARVAHRRRPARAGVRDRARTSTRRYPRGRGPCCRGHRPARRRAGQRDPHRRRRRRARAGAPATPRSAAPGPGLARPRLQLRREVRRHQRHRHRAGGPRAGRRCSATSTTSSGWRSWPARAPRSGTRSPARLLGVIDLTCWRRDAGRCMVATAVARIARQIEEALLDQSGPRELAVLHDYLIACRRNRGAVFAVSDDLLMMNDRARELIDPADQATLIAEAERGDGPGRRHAAGRRPAQRGRRPGALPARAGRPAAVVGGVLQVQLAAPEQAPRAAVARRRRPPRCRPPSASGARGRSAARPSTGTSAAGEWLVLEGEPGTGKTTIARATHQLRTPAGAPAGPRRRGLRARLGRRGRRGARDRRRHARAHRTSTGCPTTARQELADALEPYRESTDAGPALAGRHGRRRRAGPPRTRPTCWSCFPRTVAVPPLRHHVEDVRRAGAAPDRAGSPAAPS